MNSLIHFDHQMYIKGRIVIPESTTNTSPSICHIELDLDGAKCSGSVAELKSRRTTLVIG
jgi:hypothetical protein